MEAHLKRYEKEVGKKLCVPFSEADILNFMDSNSPPPYLKSLTDSVWSIFLNSYIKVGLMQKETVRSSKLRKMCNFEILIESLRTNPAATENFINWFNLKNLKANI